MADRITDTWTWHLVNFALAILMVVLGLLLLVRG